MRGPTKVLLKAQTNADTDLLVQSTKQRGSVFEKLLFNINRKLHVPFTISKLCEAVVPSACSVGPFDRRMGGDLCSHGFHQTL